MKKIFITLFLCLFIVPTMASTSRMGRLYDFISDPSNTSHKADRNNYIAWAKQNFSTYNIPLMSTIKTYPSSSFSSPVYGIDSAFKYAPIAAQQRVYAWCTAYSNVATETDVTTIISPPWLIYNPYYLLDSIKGSNIRGYMAMYGNGITAQLGNMDAFVDDLENQNGGVIPAAIPLTVTSQFKDGYITGKVEAKIDTFVTKHYYNFCTGGNKSYIKFQVILAEGYHKYGTEEHYFIPRKCLYDGNNLGGQEIEVPQNPKTTTTSFQFAIDKSWNAKYLYVIAIAEFYPCNGIANSRVLFDVACDRVVDVKNPAQHKPIKLELDYANAAHKCQKVAAGSQNVPIIFKVTNPTSAVVKAVTYINPATSIYDNWTITKNKDTIVIPPNSNTTVTLTGKAPAIAGAAAIDFCVLPIDTKEDENPIISSILALAATDSTRILTLANKIEPFKVATPINSYYENIAMIYDQYCSIIDPNMFEGYFFGLTNTASMAAFDPAIPFKNAWTVGGSISSHYTKEHEMCFYNYMDSTRVSFLNSLIEKKKYLALFTDLSPYYSTIAPASLKAEYTNLFNSFGVSFKNEMKVYADSAFVTVLNPFEGDPFVTIDNNYNNMINATMNTDNHNAAPAFTNWNVTNTSNTTKLFYYNQDYSTVAAVKYEKGSQKMFLAGFGLDVVTVNDMQTRISALFENMTTWWFGIKPKISPRISTDSNSINFGSITIGNDLPVSKKIVISNSATGSEDILKIYTTSTGFVNNSSEAFKVIKALKSELQPGEKDTLIIEFDPQEGLDLGLQHNATYRILCNDRENSMFNLYLSGIAIVEKPLYPIIIVNAGADDFYLFPETDSGKVDQQKQIKDYYIYNDGGLKLDIHSIELTDETDKEIFVLSQHTNIKEVAPSGEKTFRLRMIPTVKSGKFEGKIIIKSNAVNIPIYELEIMAIINPVSIAEEVAKMFSCKVSPNPASNQIVIDFNVIGELSRNVLLNMIDNSGRLVRTISNSQYAPDKNYKEVLDISDLPAGVYYIEYTVDNKKSATSITVTK